MDTVIDNIVSICAQHILTPDYGAIIPEPYIPFVPSNWNQILVLAEAQNLSKSNDSYVQKLIQYSTEDRIRRLYDKSANGIGINPWDDGSLKLAVAALFPDDSINSFGVSNAVLWSMRTEKQNNDNPNAFLIQKSVELWKKLLDVLDPKIIIASGTTAHSVVCGCAYTGKYINLRLPSRSAMSRISGMFNEGDLLRRFPEVNSALNKNSDIISGNYRINKIFFACHAISIGKPQL